MLRHLTSTFPKSGILLLGNSVQSLVPSTLISQAESLLDSHRIEEAVELADQQRRKLQGNVIVDEDEVKINPRHEFHLYISVSGRRIALRVSADRLPMLHRNIVRGCRQELV
jgi:hypothetical protein